MTPAELIPLLLSAGVVGALIGGWVQLLLDTRKASREDRWRFSDERRTVYAELFRQATEWRNSVERMHDELVASKLGIRPDPPVAAPELPEAVGRLASEAQLLGSKQVVVAAVRLSGTLTQLEKTRKDLLRRGVHGVLTFKDKERLDLKLGDPRSDPVLESILGARLIVDEFAGAARDDLQLNRR
jgi:hypothetical protein